MLNFSFRSRDCPRRSRSTLHISCVEHHNNCTVSDSDSDSQSQCEASAMNGPESNEYSFVKESHADTILMGLNDLRNSGQFCDVTIQVENKKFPAHRSVLSAYSPYFKAMFGSRLSESRLSVVPLNGVGADMVEMLIEYCYTGTITVTNNNCQSLLSAANLLQVPAVKDAACAFLHAHMDPSNCLGIHCFAETHACLDLAEKAKDYVLAHFSEVMESEEILSITAPKLMEFTSSDYLNVHREELVFQAVAKWYQHAPEKRRHAFPQVLSTVRLPLVSPYFLLDFVSPMPAVRDNPECLELLEEAKVYHLLPDRRSELGSDRCKPRVCSDTTTVIVIVGGEDDKVVLRTVDCYSPDTMTWKSLACLPMAVSKHGLVSSGGNTLFLVGGEYPDGSSCSGVWRYEPNLDRWQEMSKMGVARSEVSVAMLDGYLYAIGGWDGTSRLSTVERYDPATNQWTSNIRSMKIAVTSAAAIAHEGFLYVTGGAVREDGDSISMVQRYDPLTDNWSQVAEMNMPRSGAAICSLGRKIYVLGGWHASTDNTNLVECYDVATNRWDFKCPMLEKRYRPGVAVLEGKIYVFGGEDGWDKYHDSIEVYDPAAEIWQLCGEMESPRSWLGCVPLQVRKSMLRDRS